MENLFKAEGPLVFSGYLTETWVFCVFLRILAGGVIFFRYSEFFACLITESMIQSLFLLLTESVGNSHSPVVHG